MSNFKLQASPRTALGRKVRALRRTGVVPANIFGKNIPSVAIQLEVKALKEVLKQAGETSLIDLKVDNGKSHPVLVAGYAQDPISGDLLHVDFHEVDLNVKTKAMVPIHTTGESEAVKAGNVLVLQKNEIEVEALPADLPNELVIDISTLTEVGATIHAKDLSLDRAKVTLLSEEDEVIATIQEPVKEEVVAAPAEGEAGAAPDAEAAPAAEGEAKADEPKE